MYKTKNGNKLWNMIKSNKKTSQSEEAIELDALKEHLKHKFTVSEGTPANVEIIRKSVQS